MLRKFFIFLLVVSFLALVALGIGGTWGYFYLTRDLPNIKTIDDYRPQAVTTVLSNDGTPAAEFYEQRRYPVRITEVPLMVQHAFLAAEDAGFYQHKGIDPISILRAVVKNFQSGATKQGASTITQQVVKNLLLTSEKRYTRKLKEAILAYQLDRRLPKDKILEIYLNQIFFGNNAYGIKAAARAYYKKELSELTLAEAAILAGLPKAPSRYDPLRNPEDAKRRQRYVIGQMVKAGFVSTDEAEAARREKVRFYRADPKNIFYAPYYVSEVRREFQERWPELNIDRDGLTIHTALDINADKMASAAVQKGLREVDKRRGWRGPIGFVPNADKDQFLRSYGSSISSYIEPVTVYPALVTEVIRGSGKIRVDLGNHTAIVDINNAGWAKKRLDQKDNVSWIRPEEVIRKGDVIEVSQIPLESQEKGKGRVAEQEADLPRVILDQTPEIEGSLVLLQPETGKVLTVIGGYSYQRSVFDRAIQGLRQPGSTFKPVVYLSAIDGFKYTPATIVYDAPRTFRVGDQFWTPENFDETFLGPITLRTALEKSRNLVSADIVSRIGVDAVIKYAKKLGIQSQLGRNLSLALGSSEVNLLEMTRAYGVFAAKGVLSKSIFITNVVDRDGSIIYDYENERLTNATQVIDENAAFIMASLMKGVIERGTGYRVKPIGRPVAGKTGTSNDQMDAWFIGYTPQWACGVWSGFDQKKKIGDKETGGVVSAPTWLYFMSDFLKYQDELAFEKQKEEAKAEAERLGIDYQEPEPIKPLDFSVPEGVDPYWVDRDTGFLSDSSNPRALYEYFIRGTEPQRRGGEESSTSYLESPDL